MPVEGHKLIGQSGWLLAILDLMQPIPSIRKWAISADWMEITAIATTVTLATIQMEANLNGQTIQLATIVRRLVQMFVYNHRLAGVGCFIVFHMEWIQFHCVCFCVCV